MARDTVIDAVGEVVSTTPGASLPAIEDRRNALSRAYRRARGLLARQRVEAPIDAEIIPLPTASRAFGPVLWSFLACVVLPMVAAGLYYGFLASDQFVSEMRFVVRIAQQQDSPMTTVASAAGVGGGSSSGSSVPGLGSGGGGASRSGEGTAVEDAHIVTSYIRSRAMIEDLSKLVDLREVYRRPEADMIARLKRNASAEEVVEYWSKMVSTNIDATSGIVTVGITAFRADDALLLARSVEQLAEKLVNGISTRAREDSLRRARDEVERAQGRMFAALAEMERYRNAEGLVDPVQTATDTGKLLTSLLGDQLAIENQLFVANQSLSPDSPTVRNLQNRLDSLRRQVSDLRQQLAGKGQESRNVAAAIGRFEEVAVKQKIAESLYTLAANGLDRARRSAEAQSVYLTTFVPPRLPEDYTYPLRIFNPFAVGIIAFVLWGITCLVIASVEDHRIG